MPLCSALQERLFRSAPRKMLFAIRGSERIVRRSQKSIAMVASCCRDLSIRILTQYSRSRDWWILRSEFREQATKKLLKLAEEFAPASLACAKPAKDR